MEIRAGRGRELANACVVIVLFLVFLGCSSEGDPFGQNVRPVLPVGVVVPADGSTGVSPDTNITITFPLDLDIATVTKDHVHVLDYSLADQLPTLSKDKAPRTLSARVLYDTANRIITVIPDQSLTPNARYQVELQDVRSTTNIFFNTVVTTFTTGATNRPVPNVLSIIPRSGAALVPNTSTIAITFDRAMDPVSTLRALSVGPGVAGTAAFAVGVNRTVLTFTPGSVLPPSQLVNVSVRSDATDANGTPLGRDFTSTFTVEPPPSVVTDLTSPFDHQIQVPVNTPVTVVFSTTMTTSTIPAAFSLAFGSTLITGSNGTFSFATSGSPLRTSATFQSTSALPASTSVQIRVNGLAQSTRGVGLSPLFFSTFVTAP